MKTMKKLYPFIAALYLVVHPVWAQKAELVTDRPDQTEAPVLIPKGALQIETGFVMEPDQQDAYQVTNYTYNSSLIKYGINSNLELRLIMEYLGENRKHIAQDTETQMRGFSPLALGIKSKISEEKGILPQIAFIGHININFLESEFQSEYTAADFRFTFNHSLNEKFSLGYNLGAEWDGVTPAVTYLYTLAIGFKIVDNLGCFVESYGFLPESQTPDHRLDGGFTVLITPTVQWDISAGVGLTDNAPDAFVGTGVSFRLIK